MSVVGSFPHHQHIKNLDSDTFAHHQHLSSIGFYVDLAHLHILSNSLLAMIFTQFLVSVFETFGFDRLLIFWHICSRLFTVHKDCKPLVTCLETKKFYLVGGFEVAYLSHGLSALLVASNRFVHADVFRLP